ncbi:MAG TPA: hypothetical protein VJV23_14430 [Candidatus Polarisedimenticolia bacterium]|nr:hypothetical protein [Candidatus Polarisedimenticolia bacterium]
MSTSGTRRPAGGNGKHQERRTGVDRRIADDPGYAGPERRKSARRKLDRHPDKPLKR